MVVYARPHGGWEILTERISHGTGILHELNQGTVDIYIR